MNSCAPPALCVSRAPRHGSFVRRHLNFQHLCGHQGTVVAGGPVHFTPLTTTVVDVVVRDYGDRREGLFASSAFGPSTMQNSVLPNTRAVSASTTTKPLSMRSRIKGRVLIANSVWHWRNIFTSEPIYVFPNAMAVLRFARVDLKMEPGTALPGVITPPGSHWPRSSGLAVRVK